MLLARLSLIVGLALLPSTTLVQAPRPNALEVGAGVATCMTESRDYPPNGGVVLYGTAHHATLIENGVPFATIHRRAYNPAEEPELANDPVQPPMAFDALPSVGEDELRMRETMRYALNCFGKVYWGS